MKHHQKGIAEKYISITSDVSIRYCEAGTEHKQAVVLIHGIGSAIESWRPLFAFLSPHYHVIAIDIPGLEKTAQRNDTKIPNRL